MLGALRNFMETGIYNVPNKKGVLARIVLEHSSLYFWLSQ